MAARRLTALALAMAVFNFHSAAAQEPPATPSSVDETLLPYASTADSVTLPDGRELHLVCMGEGLPTVILTAGMGEFAGPAWNTVQRGMAGFARVCSWDRPGFGLSAGSAERQTVATTTADLEAALAAAAIEGPLVMVGHSLGALESLLFADRNPGRVAGMVLIDPSVPDQDRLVERVAPALKGGDPNEQPLVRGLRLCAAEIRTAAERRREPPDECFRYPLHYPAALREALTIKARDPLYYDSAASFLASADHFGLAANPARNYGDMPLVVLTATNRAPPPNASPESAAPRAAFNAALELAHAELAALSTRGTRIDVDSGHYVQRTHPQVVIDAVEAIVTEARAAAR